MDNEEQILRKIIATNMRIARAREDITQEVLAERTNISTKHITKIENAKVTTNIYFIKKIAEALDLTLEEITTEYKKKNNNN